MLGFNSTVERIVIWFLISACIINVGKRMGKVKMSLAFMIQLD